MGLGAMRPLDDDLKTLPVRSLFLAGALDEKYAALARALAAGVPLGEAAWVPDAGHAAHLEQPAALAALLEGFWASTVSAPRPRARRPPRPRR
jgi:pimeloyl-ACP methyl ester carboxylesterase